ncbi:MAG: hypothetical protein ABIJ65_11780 [Chloroflexota bacterium]
MKRTYFKPPILVVLILLVACSPSEATIQISEIEMQQTVEQIVSGTMVANKIQPTSTQSSIFATLTAMPKKPINTALPQYQKTYDTILFDIGNMLESAPDIDSVTTIRPGKDSLEIELRVKWASRDRQPNASFEVIELLAIVFGGTDEGKAMNFVTGNPAHFSILLNTYSADGDYKYSSLTYYDTLVKLNKKQITYDEWVSESGAGFVP